MGQLRYRFHRQSLVLNFTRRFSSALGITFCCIPAAVPFDTAAASVAATCQFSGICLGSVRADLDGDGKPDAAELVYDQRTKLFSVLIRIADGNFYRPLAGAVDRRDQLPSMKVRTGSGDLRCRLWSDGTVCGYPTLSDAPSTALYVTAGNGKFVIYITAPIIARSGKASGNDRSKAYTVVVPALEGEAVVEMMGS